MENGVVYLFDYDQLNIKASYNIGKYKPTAIKAVNGREYNINNSNSNKSNINNNNQYNNTHNNEYNKNIFFLRY